MKNVRTNCYWCNKRLSDFPIDDLIMTHFCSDHCFDEWEKYLKINNEF